MPRPPQSVDPNAPNYVPPGQPLQVGPGKYQTPTMPAKGSPTFGVGALPGIHGSKGGGLFGGITNLIDDVVGGVGGVVSGVGGAIQAVGDIAGGGGGGPGIDIQDYEEQMAAFKPLLKMLQDQGIINTPVDAQKAMDAWQQKQDHTKQLETERRKRLTGQYGQDFQSKLAKQLVARGMGPDSANRLAREQAARVAQGVPTGPGNISNYYGQTALDTALANVQNTAQTENTTQFNATTPADFARNAFSDTADDQMIEQMITKSRDDAIQQLRAQRDRGVLDNEGYNAAVAKLTGDTAGVRERLNTIGGGILGGYRTELGNFATTLRDEMAANPFGAYNRGTNKFTGQLGERVKSSMAGLEGAFKNAAGTEPLFNVNSLVQSGATKQGAINPAGMGTATGFKDALAARRKLETGGRGVGSTGVF